MYYLLYSMCLFLKLLGNLTSHMRTPTGEKYFAHTLCSYRAAQRKHLSRFTLPHTGKKLYACIQCSYRSAGSEHLSSHMHSHTGMRKVYFGSIRASGFEPPLLYIRCVGELILAFRLIAENRVIF